MANAWLTKAVNNTRSEFKILQDDASWRPIVNGLRFEKNQPIIIPAEIPAGTTKVIEIPMPPPLPPIKVLQTFPQDAPGRIDIQYCVIPWTGYGRLQLVGPTGNTVDFNVGSFVDPGKDHLRAIQPNGNILLMQELGNKGGGWWSMSVDLGIYIDESTFRITVESQSRGAEGVVASLAEALRVVGPKLLEALLKKL
jgi:hypothetical protein